MEFGRWASKPAQKVCQIHGEQMFYIGPNNVLVCSKCGKELIERDEQKLQDDFWEVEERRLEAKRIDVLFNSSIVNAELKQATLNNYEVLNQDQKEKLDIAFKLASGYIAGDTNNTLFLGPAGTGKSHLAYGIIKHISDKTKKHAMFIKIPELLARIKSDFNSSEQTQQKWIARLSKVPYLVLDDLGTEKVTDWSKEILFSILDNRNCTIITSNLRSSAEIGNIYGEAIKDRICKGVDRQHGISFDGMKSQRRKHY